jgi:hypothetical protein
MLNLIADFCGQTRLVGRCENMKLALNLSDNIGSLFSDCNPPQRVTVTIENTVGELVLQTGFHGGFITYTNSNDELVERYSV